MYNALLEYEVRAMVQQAEREAAARCQRRRVAEGRTLWWRRRRQPVARRANRRPEVLRAE